MPNPDFTSPIYRPPTLEECQEAFEKAGDLEGLPEDMADWIRSHSAIGVYGKPALILPGPYCESVGCDVWTRTPFCKDHWFVIPDRLKRSLQANGEIWGDDPDLEVLMSQAILFECVFACVDEDSEDEGYLHQVRMLRARHRVIQGELHRAFESRKPPPPKKPVILISREPLDKANRNFAAFPAYPATFGLPEFDGVCLSAIPFSRAFIAKAKAEGWTDEDVRVKAVQRYTDSLAEGHLRPPHISDEGAVSGLRGYDAPAWYVSARVDGCVPMEHGDCIVVGDVEGFSVDYGVELAKFLTYGGFGVLLYGEPLTLDEENYYADFEYRGGRLDSHRRRPVEGSEGEE